MPENQSLNTIYLVTGSNKPVTLEIIIGAPGQTAKTDIAVLDTIVNLLNHDGSLSETDIGSNKSLDGKVLFITSTISDTSRDTNFTELIIRLRGGVNFREYNLSKTVNAEGQSVPYICVIEFFKF